MLSSCLIAFAMYSKIPMPRVEWSEEKMRYVLCFFPWVGIPVGLLTLLVFFLTQRAGFGSLFSAALLTAVPILVTGGIHMDGFMDTMDARSSWGDRERKLEILKDSHTGAFAILGCAVYLLLQAGAWSEITRENVPVAACIFFYSRCLSGLGIVAFPCARDSGLARTFHDAAQRRTVCRVLLLETVLVAALLLWLDGLLGGAVILTGLLVFAYYRRFSLREFGGITGDLAGYFLQLCELAQLLVLAVLPKLL
ncbi:MAG: adenosylcobinamide-GDP ribazoletransferase [Lachnospiraceae bacterium]|nr:adenosylcobinamide-GDP ribazoletransferase [Lachnospiraceae bacterium]